MFIKLDPTENRPAVVALVLVLFWLVGCSDEPGADVNAGDGAYATASDVVTGQREVVLSVPGMDCPMCPITVQRALSRVDGVYEAEADLNTKQALAVFDPARTDLEALIAAIKNSGFSAELRRGGNE